MDANRRGRVLELAKRLLPTLTKWDNEQGLFDSEAKDAFKECWKVLKAKEPFPVQTVAVRIDGVPYACFDLNHQNVRHMFKRLMSEAELSAFERDQGP